VRGGHRRSTPGIHDPAAGPESGTRVPSALHEHETVAGRPAAADGGTSPRRRRAWRRPRVVLPVLALVVLLLPVPWLHMVSDSPPGTAWRLDGRLYVDGHTIDPPGEWSWLTVGRPPLVAEVLWTRLTEDEPVAMDLRDAPVTGRPALNEPAAAAVGLRHAGIDVPLGLIVEAREPTLPGYPEVAVIVEAHGIVLSDRDDYDRARALIEALANDQRVEAVGEPDAHTSAEDADTVLRDDGDGTGAEATEQADPAVRADATVAPLLPRTPNPRRPGSGVPGHGEAPARASVLDEPPTARSLEVTFKLSDGREFQAPGPWLPYNRVNVLDIAPDDLEAGIAGPFDWLAELAPVDWFRNLNLGRSHGTMVALTTYAEASGEDLAQGRHVAGTGGIRGDGTVTRIGGLEAKATAARRAGADVLVFPTSQADGLEGFDARGMTLLPVETLSEAIAWLRQPLV
jgi:hypothetical protein